MDITTISPKWQVCILKDVREKLGLKPNQKLVEEVEDDKIVMRPLRTLECAGGSLRGLSGGKTTQKVVDELKKEWE